MQLFDVVETGRNLSLQQTKIQEIKSNLGCLIAQFLIGYFLSERNKYAPFSKTTYLPQSAYVLHCHRGNASASNTHSLIICLHQGCIFLSVRLWLLFGYTD